MKSPCQFYTRLSQNDDENQVFLRGFFVFVFVFSYGFSMDVFFVLVQ